MDIIKMTRELGKEIQNSPEYKRLSKANTANDNDTELQDMIKEFNLKRIQLSNAMQKETQDADEMNNLNKNLKETYTKVMDNKNMIEFNMAKHDIDELMKKITGILMLTVNGEDPETCDPSSCSGNCENCSSCN